MKYIPRGLASIVFITLLGILPLHFSCEKNNITETENQLDTITDYDGNIYYAKKIGDQWWMVNNLKSTHYSDGTEILIVENRSAWDVLGKDDKAYCYYNNNENDEASIYGTLYTWAAAMNGEISNDDNPSVIQGVCPDGWHLPSDSEWKELEMYLGMVQADVDKIGYRGLNEGSKLASSQNLWAAGSLVNDTTFGTSGFNALPGGGRRYNGTFGHLGDNANFWSATEKDSSVAWGRHLYSEYSASHRYSNVKSDGFSVRCVKDD